MASLSVGTAWNETTAFVKREGGLLFPIALALIALPSILIQWLTPTAAPGESPPLGLWTWLFLPAMVVTLLGSLAIVILALRRETLVGAALATAGRRLLPLFGTLILLVLMMVAIVIPLAIIGALVGGTAQPVTPGSPAVTLTVIFAMVAILLLSIRFLLVNQVAAATDLGPIAILKRSWALTRGHFWKLFGLLVLVGIVLLVLALAVTAVGGILVTLLTGSTQPGSLGTFLVLVLLGLLNGIFTVYLLVLLTRVYEQLAREQASGI